jgi:hypothetical protein
MAWSSAACVLGGVRLISSASRMFVKIGPSTKRNCRRPYVRGHQVGRELDALETNIQDPRQRADHQRLGQPGNPFQQTVAAGEDGGEDLLDDVLLADDDLLQFLQHDLAVLGKLLQNVA